NGHTTSANSDKVITDGILGHGPFPSPSPSLAKDLNEQATRNPSACDPSSTTPLPHMANQGPHPIESQSFRDVVSGAPTAKPSHQRLTMESFRDKQSGTVTRSEEGRFKVSFPEPTVISLAGLLDNALILKFFFTVPSLRDLSVGLDKL
ncbi:Unknown protein, partial [Striga hermonthica]